MICVLKFRDPHKSPFSTELEELIEGWLTVSDVAEARFVADSVDFSELAPLLDRVDSDPAPGKYRLNDRYLLLVS
jgi:hypothetical protein